MLRSPLGPLLAFGRPLAHSRQLRRGCGAKFPAGLQVGRARRADHADRRAGAAPVQAGGDGLDGPDRAAREAAAAAGPRAVTAAGSRAGSAAGPGAGSLVSGGTTASIGDIIAWQEEVFVARQPESRRLAGRAGHALAGGVTSSWQTTWPQLVWLS